MRLFDLRDVQRLALLRSAFQNTLFRQVGWTTSSYIAVQAIRFVTNLILTRLLAPELFGIMMILTSIRVGIELFTDIGIGQNIIASRRALDPEYYNTAWTLQLVRGVLLAVVSLALLPVLSAFYDQKEIHQILPVLSVLFILAGSHSVGLSLAVKALQTRKIARFDIVTAGLGSIFSILCAWIWPNIWGLIAGNVVSTFITAALSYAVYPGLKYNLKLKLSYVSGMLHFGKWVFLSSIVFFFATNIDRLVLGKYITLTSLGVYGIARSLGDIFSQFATRLGNAIIFPSIASTELRGDALRQKLSSKRFHFIAASAMAVCTFMALSDVVIRLLYDHRYAPAAPVLPWIGVAAWLGIINTLNDSVLLGLSKPKYTAFGNVTKLGVIIALLPAAVVHYNIIGAALTTIAAETARYVVLGIAQSKEKVRFFGQDILMTVALFVGAFSIRLVGHQIGITGSPGLLFAI